MKYLSLNFIRTLIKIKIFTQKLRKISPLETQLISWRTLFLICLRINSSRLSIYSLKFLTLYTSIYVQREQFINPDPIHQLPSKRVIYIITASSSVNYIYTKREAVGGWHSTEVAFALLTQLARARFSPLPRFLKFKFEFSRCRRDLSTAVHCLVCGQCMKCLIVDRTHLAQDSSKLVLLKKGEKQKLKVYFSL